MHRIENMTLFANGLTRTIITTAGILFAWQLIIWLTAAPPFILPPPLKVLSALGNHAGELLDHGLITFLEIVLGLTLGCALGFLSGLSLSYFQPARRWLLPVFVASQALPVFALAPLLTLWFGYGLASKIAMATLIIYFPVTAACYDGLRHTPRELLDLAKTMGADAAGILRHIRLPAALPALCSGIRVATAVAPIGAVVGEWVGASRGLGFLMLHANARLQTDLMFAALLVICVIAIGLYYTVNALLRRLLYWQPETLDKM